MTSRSGFPLANVLKAGLIGAAAFLPLAFIAGILIDAYWRGTQGPGPDRLAVC